MPITIILYQIAILAILTLIGAGGFRLRILNEEAKTVIEKLVFNITTPLLILTKVSSLSINPEVFRNGLYVIVFAYLIIFIQILAGRFTGRVLRLPHAQAVIHQLHTYMGNIVFLGFPLIDALFPGGESLLYGAIYQLVSNTVMWTHGIVKLAPSSGARWWHNLKNLLNPNTIALLIALVMILFDVKLPGILDESLGGIGSTTLYLAMIYIGILLARSNLLLVLKRVDAIVLSVNKMLLLPLVVTVLIGWLISVTSVPFSDLAFSVLILQSAMPCMTLLVIIARRYGADDVRAMENFVVSTLLSVITLPAVIYLTGLIQRIF